jgi:hypothetical protein
MRFTCSMRSVSSGATPAVAHGADGLGGRVVPAAAAALPPLALATPATARLPSPPVEPAALGLRTLLLLLPPPPLQAMSSSMLALMLARSSSMSSCLERIKLSRDNEGGEGCHAAAGLTTTAHYSKSLPLLLPVASSETPALRMPNSLSVAAAPAGGCADQPTGAGSAVQTITHNPETSSNFYTNLNTSTYCCKPPSKRSGIVGARQSPVLNLLPLPPLPTAAEEGCGSWCSTSSCRSQDRSSACTCDRPTGRAHSQTP